MLVSFSPKMILSFSPGPQRIFRTEEVLQEEMKNAMNSFGKERSKLRHCRICCSGRIWLPLESES